MKINKFGLFKLPQDTTATWKYGLLLQTNLHIRFVSTLSFAQP